MKKTTKESGPGGEMTCRNVKCSFYEVNAPQPMVQVVVGGSVHVIVLVHPKFSPYLKRARSNCAIYVCRGRNLEMSIRHLGNAVHANKSCFAPTRT